MAEKMLEGKVVSKLELEFTTPKKKQEHSLLKRKRGTFNPEKSENKNLRRTTAKVWRADELTFLEFPDYEDEGMRTSSPVTPSGSASGTSSAESTALAVTSPASGSHKSSPSSCSVPTEELQLQETLLESQGDSQVWDHDSQPYY